MEDISVEIVSTLPDDPATLIELTRKLRDACRQAAVLTAAAYVLASQAASKAIIDDQLH